MATVSISGIDKPVTLVRDVGSPYSEGVTPLIAGSGNVANASAAARGITPTRSRLARRSLARRFS